MIRNACFLPLLVTLLGCGGEAPAPETAAPSEPVASPEPVADLVLRNGKVVTVDDANPEASAIAVVDGRIVAVGSDEDIDSLVGDDTEIVDLAGRLAIPGFIEGHGHFTSLGQAKMVLDLTKAKSWDEIVAMVEEAASTAPEGAWIQGRGWHQEKWEEVPWPNVEGLPLHDGLSAVSPNNPVLLGHASGHGSFANAAALEAGGIDRETLDPPGGEIVRDSDGRPTGALRETAQRIVGEAYQRYLEKQPPEERRQAALKAVELAAEESLRKGVTSFHDAGSSFETIDFLRELAAAGELPLRLYVMVRFESNEVMAEKLPEYRRIDEGGGFLTVRSIKRQIDGALGAHGAWLLKPYDDLPTSTGLVLETPEDIYRTAELAIKHGYQLNTHAIGDRANREVLDLYQKAMEEAGADSAALRWRIEHAQHVDPADLPRFAELNIIASMQGNHCTSDGPWVSKRLGEWRTRQTSYLWRSFIDAGVVVTNGTDVPVEDIDPLVSFYASVTRMTVAGPFMPEQVMTREEALKTYTINAAFSAFEEDDKGSITPGKYADIVVLSKDILTIPPEEILEAKIDYTLVGGEIRYRRGDS
ncbi:MAG: amidohydrolase [Pseudomonadota bacterium]